MLPLKKLDSTVVCSTHTYESSVVKESVAKLWPLFRSFSFDKLIPKNVFHIFLVMTPNLLKILTQKGFKSELVRRNRWASGL